jgi:hypothetical protein
MRTLRFPWVCSYALGIVAAVLATRASAEPVQVSMTVDANTTALYLFKEGTGSTSSCEKAGVPSATLTMTTSWVPGRQYYAVATDTGYMTIADNVALRPVTAITVEAWVKLVRPGGDLVVKESMYFFRLGSTISASFAVGGSSWTSFSGTLPVPAGQWTHLAITFNSITHIASIYINGVLDTTHTCGTGTLNPATGAVWVGRNDYAAGSNVDGKIDSLRISNIARAFVPLAPFPPQPPLAKGNLVPNGDFEIGLTGWRGRGYGDVNLMWETTGGAATGQKCLHTIPSARTDFSALLGGVTPSGVVSRPIPARPGRHYNFSLRMKTDAKQYPRIEIDGVGGASGFKSFSPFPVYPSVTTSWQQFQYSFTLPANFVFPSLAVVLPYPSSGELYVDDVRLTADETSVALALKDRISVGPQTLPVGNVYFAGIPTPTMLNIVNTDGVAHDVTVQPTIVDWEGKQVSAGPSLGTVSVPANGVKTAIYNINTNRRGTFRLGFDLSSEGQTWHQLAEVEYAVVVNLQGVGNPDTSMFAMNMHLEREPATHLARETQVLSECGVKWIRAWWGWGMCENPQGTYSFAEYDRQYNVINGAQMRVMCVLLRYYPSFEYSWSGSLSTVQQPPFPAMMGQWGLYCGKVAQHFAGNIKAYEIWNEPTTDNNGAITASTYAQILSQAATGIRANDPNATIVAFAGVGNNFITSVLALTSPSNLDVASEHSYGQIMTPEASYPGALSAMKGALSGGGAGSKPIWDTEQGMVTDGDGYRAPSTSEADGAQIYVRDIVTAHSQGSQKFFWFSADVSPDYGSGLFFGSYTPSPRLAALASCASFIDGLTYQKFYNPSSNNSTYAHLYKGSNTGVCVVWNTTMAVNLSLAISSNKVQAFDTMGNAIPVGGTTTATIQIPRERPAFVQCAVDDYSLLDSAISGMQITATSPVAITASPVVGGVQVTLTGASPTPVDGIVDLIPAVTTTPKGWPVAQHFDSLASGKSKSFRFTLPAKAAVSQVRVRAGDLRMVEVRVPYTTH